MDEKKLTPIDYLLTSIEEIIDYYERNDSQADADDLKLVIKNYKEMDHKKTQETVAELKKWQGDSDQEIAHWEADKILYGFVPKEIADEWDKVGNGMHEMIIMNPTIQTEINLVMKGMEMYGIPFVKCLAEALYYTDMENAAKIKRAFPEYWKTYLKIGKEIKNEDKW